MAKAIAIALNLVWPSDTALTSAALSAQIVSPQEAFSTLQPERQTVLETNYVKSSVECLRNHKRSYMSACVYYKKESYIPRPSFNRSKTW